MDRGSASVDIITVHGPEHVMVINGIVFKLDPAMFDPAIKKIEWAAGQGVLYWADGRKSLFGKEGFETYVAPLVKAFSQAEKTVEHSVVILDSESHKSHFAKAKQRSVLLGQIREVEEKLNRSTQAILAAQLSGRTPEPEDIRHFLNNYTKKVEMRAQLASLDSE